MYVQYFIITDMCLFICIIECVYSKSFNCNSMICTSVKYLINKYIYIHTYKIHILKKTAL